MILHRYYSFFKNQPSLEGIFRNSLELNADLDGGNHDINGQVFRATLNDQKVVSEVVLTR